MHNKAMQFADDNQPATKGDIRSIREDLKGFATKEDIGSIREEFIEYKDELVFKNRMALDAIELRTDLGAMGEKLSKLILQTRSDLIDLLEGRVAALESPQKPQRP